MKNKPQELVGKCYKENALPFTYHILVSRYNKHDKTYDISQVVSYKGYPYTCSCEKGINHPDLTFKPSGHKVECKREDFDKVLNTLIKDMKGE